MADGNVEAPERAVLLKHEPQEQRPGECPFHDVTTFQKEYPSSMCEVVGVKREREEGGGKGSSEEREGKAGDGEAGRDGVAGSDDEETASDATVSEGGGGGGGDGGMDELRDVDYGDFLQQKANELLQRLRDYKAIHGDCNVPREYPEDPTLGAWVHEQRERYKQGTLPKERIAALSEAGFVWESQNDITWREKYERLVAYKEEKGDCQVPGTYLPDQTLAVWVKYQRDAKRRGRLKPWQIAKLEEIGFQWELTLEKQWNDKFEKLKAYHQTYGDCNVPYTFSEDPALGMWVKYQRDAKRRGRINKKYAEQLEELGFQWEPTLDKQWNDKFDKLVAYRREYGDCNVPSTFSDQALAGWVGYQRERFRAGKLLGERVKMLEGIGFQFDAGVATAQTGKSTGNTEGEVNLDKDGGEYCDFLSTQWNSYYEKLRQYKDEHGDCDVPKDWPNDPGLGAWVNEQRERRKKEQLPEDRVDKLTQLGFQWKNPADILWDEQFERLVAYKKQYGTTAVPHNFSEDQKLANWVAYQKERIRKGKLQPDRLERLKELGFEWEPLLERQWNEKFERLTAFKAINGHCNVPNMYQEDPQLGAWVSYQRERWRKGKLTKSNYRRLTEIGFNFLSGGGGGTTHTPRASCDMEGVSTTSEGVPKWKSPDGGTAAGMGQSSYDDPGSDREINRQEGHRSNKYGSYTHGNGAGTSKNHQLAQGWRLPSEEDTESEEMHHKERYRRQLHKEAGSPNVQSMAATLKRTAQELSSYAEQMDAVTSKKRRLKDKLKSLQGSHNRMEKQYQMSVQKVMEQDETIKYLQKREEVMTSSMSRADQSIDSLKRKIEELETTNMKLERLSQSKPGVEGGNGGLLCHGCSKRPPNCVMVPCLHLMFCKECVSAAHAKAKVCPACFAPCVSVMEVNTSLS